jgi:hypothetical protein
VRREFFVSARFFFCPVFGGLSSSLGRFPRFDLLTRNNILPLNAMIRLGNEQCFAAIGKPTIGMVWV